MVSPAYYQPTKVPIDAHGLSGDGRVVVGSYQEKPCIWTEASGKKLLPLPKGTSTGDVCEASADGTAFVGISRNDNQLLACFWSHGHVTVLTETDDWPAISADGTTVVGSLAQLNEKAGRFDTKGAFRWRKKTGLKRLPMFYTGGSGFARSCSGDGNIVVGYARTGKDQSAVPCFWKSSGPPIAFPIPSSLKHLHRAYKVSDQGDVAVGWSAEGKVVLWSIGPHPQARVLKSDDFMEFVPNMAPDGRHVFDFGGLDTWKLFEWLPGRPNPVNLTDKLHVGRLARLAGISSDGGTIVVIGSQEVSWLCHIAPPGNMAEETPSFPAPKGLRWRYSVASGWVLQKASEPDLYPPLAAPKGDYWYYSDKYRWAMLPVDHLPPTGA